MLGGCFSHSVFNVQSSMFECSPTMIPRSIKWRLQLWYGLILVAVLAGFGFTAYQLESTAYQLENARRLRRVDEELNIRSDFLANGLHLPPTSPTDPAFLNPSQQHPELNGRQPPLDQLIPVRPSSFFSPDYQARLNDLLDSPRGRELFGRYSSNRFRFSIVSPEGDQFLMWTLTGDGRGRWWWGLAMPSLPTNHCQIRKPIFSKNPATWGFLKQLEPTGRFVRGCRPENLLKFAVPLIPNCSN